MSKARNTKPSAGRKTSGGGSSSPMDLGLLEQIVRLMAANDLNTVDVRDGEKRVILKRGAAGVQQVPVTLPAMAPAVQSSAVGRPEAPAPPREDESSYTPIKSPMVGTFYAAPSPEARPFVAVGSVVDEEADVCVIEAMKVFNNIKAECRGTIAKVLIANGQTVEFGQTLFLVKPS